MFPKIKVRRFRGASESGEERVPMRKNSFDLLTFNKCDKLQQTAEELSCPHST